MNNLNLSGDRLRAYQTLQSFTLMDDTFMTSVFDNDTEVTAYLINTILGRNDIHVISVVAQDSINNLYGRGVRLDITAVDSNGKIYNIEVQNNDSGAVPERARFNSALLDTHLTESGQKYDEIPETYVIFMTKNDVLKGGLAKYTIERMILELNKPFDDRAHIIYVNCSYNNTDTLGNLIHDFKCKDYRDMYNSTLASRVKYYKEVPKGVAKMCDKMEAVFDEIRAETNEKWEAIVDGKMASTVLRLWENGIHDISLIAKSVDLPESTVEDILQKSNSKEYAAQTDNLKKLNL